jgi:hypothetical protein
LTNFELLNERYEELWGMYWNMGAFDEALDRRSEKLWFRLVGRRSTATGKMLGRALFSLAGARFFLMLGYWAVTVLRGGAVPEESSS